MAPPIPSDPFRVDGKQEKSIGVFRHQFMRKFFHKLSQQRSQLSITFENAKFCQFFSSRNEWK